MLKTKVNIALAYLALVEKYSILNVSNDAIIQEAGVSRGTFYNNFSRQQDILAYIQHNIEIELINPIQARLSALPTSAMNPDNVILVISEVLIPIMAQRAHLFTILYRCKLDHLWMRPLLTVFERFINPMQHQQVTNDSKVAIGYILLILESWIADPAPMPIPEFKIKFSQLLRKSATGLLGRID